METTIFDNGGATFDRFTIILKDGETFAASGNPFHPQGFGQYCGNAVELAFPNMAKAWYDRKRGRYPKDCIKMAFSALKKEWIERGETILELSELPEQVKQYINQIEKP